MIISVISGKSGTGKTTVATNLAASIGNHVRFLDCDVQKSNAHHFFRPKQVKRQIVKTSVPRIDDSLCNECGLCEQTCRFSAIMRTDNTLMTFPEMCHSCMECMKICPENAISEAYRNIGLIVTGHSKKINLVYGRLRAGEAMLPSLIEKMKEYVNRDKITIIDAPHGTSYPVIAVISGSDFVLLVTEPTPFGLNDLKPVVETLRIMNLPFGLIINRCAGGNDSAKKYAEKEGIPVMMEIPDKREITDSISKGTLMTDIIPEMTDSFKLLYHKITDYLNTWHMALRREDTYNYSEEKQNTCIAF